MILHAFQGGADGDDPIARLTQIGGTLYGTTARGGAGNCTDGCGTIFAVKP